MKRIAIVLVSLLLAVGALAGCGQNDKGEDKSISVAMLDGAPLLTMAKMVSDDFAIEHGYDTDYTFFNDSDMLVASLMNKEPDLAIAPINVAAIMHNNNSGYRLAGVSIWGIMHIVSNQNISSLSELVGETVFAFGKSGTPGITLRAVLDQSEIPHTEYSGSVANDKVNIVYLTAASDVRNAIIVGTLDGIAVKHALLAEPVATAIAGATATAAHGQFSAKINIQTEWAKNNNDETYPQAALIFHERLLESDKDFLDKFIAMTELSSIYAKTNPKEAGDLAVAIGSTAIPNGTVIQNAANAGRLPLNFTRAPEAKSAVEAYLDVLLIASPTLIGGKMPSESFYYGAT